MKRGYFLPSDPRLYADLYAGLYAELSADLEGALYAASLPPIEVRFRLVFRANCIGGFDTDGVGCRPFGRKKPGWERSRRRWLRTECRWRLTARSILPLRSRTGRMVDFRERTWNRRHSLLQTVHGRP